MPSKGRYSVVELLGTTGTLEKHLNHARELGGQVISAQAVDSNFLHPQAYPKADKNHTLDEEVRERSIRMHTWIVIVLWPDESTPT